jgi:beta-glucosidase
VLACAKHFVGDGATSWGTAPRFEWTHWWDGWGDAWQIDQGDARISEDVLRSTHLSPYRAAVEAGVMTVMASYNAWNGDKLHGHRHLLTDVLKGELGFPGFVVTDWMGIDQLAPSYETCVITAINAGIDMVMVPIDFSRFLEAMNHAVADGSIPLERIDDAVRRILTAKTLAGLFEAEADVAPLTVIGSAEHRRLAAEAVRRSAVLLKNDGALPLSPRVGSVGVAGDGADDIGIQCGGWTVGWQGGIGTTTAGTTLLDGLRRTVGADLSYEASGRFPEDDHFDIGIVCIAEPPYAEGPGDRAVPAPTERDREVFARIRARSDTLVLVVYSGRPLIIPDLVEQADAVVAAWLPGSEAGALADILTGLHDFAGRTRHAWPSSSQALDDGGIVTPTFERRHGMTMWTAGEPT